MCIVILYEFLAVGLTLVVVNDDQKSQTTRQSKAIRDDNDFGSDDDDGPCGRLPTTTDARVY
jgi:hypothetical protein